MAFSFTPQPPQPNSTAIPSPFSFTTPSSTLAQQQPQPQPPQPHQHSNHPTQPLQESRRFITQAYTLWASLQKIVEDYEATAPTSGFRIGRSVPEPPPPPQVQYYKRVASLYREAIVKELPLVKADPTLSPAAKSKALEHYATMHGVLALAEILYFPADGQGEGLVAEELLDWVNTVDQAPSAEEGAELSSLAAPWESPTFFPYLHRCLLRGHLTSASALLSLLASSHPSPLLQNLAALVVPLLDAYPRSPAFRTEPAFLGALRAWKTSLSAAQRSAEALFTAAASDPVLGGAPGSAAAEDRAEWVSSFRLLLDLLRGDEPTLLDLCEDWREALAARGLWVAPSSLRREDLPAAAAAVVRSHPVDQTLPDEVAQLALVMGDAAGTLKALTRPYPWLATHLADLLSQLHLAAFDLPSIPARLTDGDAEGTEEDEDLAMGLGLREHFLLDWADRLVSSDPGLWRVACEYLGACGGEGRRRAREVLKGVELGLETDAEEVGEGEEGGEGGMEVDIAVQGGEGEGKEGGKGKKTKRVEEVLRVCADLGLEDEVVGICTTYASQLVDKKRYGEAIAFSVRAADARRIAEIVNLILEEYIENGQDAFISHVDSIPTSLLRPSSSSSSPPSSPSSTSSFLPSAPADALPYSSRLAFLARYRDFFALYASGARAEAAELLVLLLTSGVAPQGFRAVLLLDALPLLETSPPLIPLPSTFELLRVLESVVQPVACASPPADVFGHLSALGRIAARAQPQPQPGKAGEAKDAEAEERERTQRALGQMEVVRGALARHLALCCCLE